jgi:hypothetical protein
VLRLAFAEKSFVRRSRKSLRFGQVRARIVKQVVLELFFRPLALGDVAIHNHQLRHCTLGIPDRARHRLSTRQLPSLVLDTIFQPLSCARLSSLARRVEHPEAIVRMNLLEGGSFPQLRRRVTQGSFVNRTVVPPPLPIH